MAEILPFRGIRYNEEKVAGLETVTAPPYDIVSPQDRDRLYEKSDCNIIRLILGKDFPGDDVENNKYIRAADFLHGWLREGILREDEKEGVYIYEQEYSYKGSRKTRRGFIALLRLEDFGRGRVFPHEETLSRPKRDRLNLMRVCRANLSPIFTLYSDPMRVTDEVLKEGEELFEVKDAEGIKHKVRNLTSGEKIGKLKGFLKDKEIYIADGHHRYETALNFRNEMRRKFPRDTGGEAYNYLMTYFVNMDNEGLITLPAHRLIFNPDGLDVNGLREELSRVFEITSFGTGEDKLRGLLSSLKEGNGDREHLFGMYDGDNLYLLRLRDETELHRLVKGNKSWNWKRLDITILHRVILDGILAGGERLDEEKIDYRTDAGEAFRLVREGRYQLAFFVNPTRVSQVRNVTRVGEKMPGKATYFYPKLLSGLLMRKIS